MTDSAPPSSAAIQFAVVTYNVLSSALADPGWFKHCDPLDLEATTRLTRVLAKLACEIERQAIICLQEVSRDWSGVLHAFFQQRNYTFIDSLYGGAMTGYMGVGIAFPNGVWSAKDVDIRRVSETKAEWHLPRREWRPAASSARPGDWTCPACQANVFAKRMSCYKCQAPKPAATNVAFALWDWLRGASAICKCLERPPTPAPLATSVAASRAADEMQWYEASQRKENTMVAVHLQCKERPTVAMWCGTYHMPCAFTQPKLMAMHASLAMQHLQQLAAVTGAPCLLGGDWNIKPTDPAYQLLTRGSMESTLMAHYPAGPEGDTWAPDLRYGMASAYAMAHGGSEPDFTNYAQVRTTPTRDPTQSTP